MDQIEKPSYEELEKRLAVAEQDRNFYKLIADNTYDWESYRNAEGKLVYVNAAFERISGYKVSDYLNGSVTVKDFIHPDDQADLQETYLSLFHSKDVRINKVRIIRSDKKIRVIRIYSIPVLHDGELIGIRTSARDITNEEDYLQAQTLNNKLSKLVNDLKSSKRKEEKSNKQFKDMFLSMMEGVYIHELVFNDKKQAINYRIIGANPISEKHLGINPNDAIGKLATELYQVPEAPFLDIYSKAALKGKNAKFDAFFEPLGKWFSISVFRLGKKKFATIFTDITDKVKWETSLKEAKDKAEDSELKLHALINAIPDLIWLKDVEGVFLGCNARFEQLYGSSEDEIIGKTDYDFVDKHIADFFRKNDNVALDAGLPTKNEEVVQFASDGHEEYLETIKTPLFDIDGEIVGVLGIGRNITERKIAESELVKSKELAEKADRAKSLFLSNMSHEIRTPMNGIMGFADLLDDQNLTNKQRENYIKIIKNSGKQLLKIIDDILEISRLETKRVKAVFEDLNLNELLTELYSIFKIDSKSTTIPFYLKTAFQNNESVIYSDRSKLITILSNLLENAFRYTEIGYIELGYFTEKENIVIYVKDTGIGIEKEKQNLVFERFTQAEGELSVKSGGLGLGLSIVKENVGLIGAQIWLESELHVGTTFFLSIPIKSEIKKSTEEESNPGIFVEGKKNPLILIAEDEEINYIYLETLLNNIGSNYQVIHAQNGKEVVEFVKNNSDIDLILMDLKMPFMNGYDATRAVKKLNPNIPVIAQTAYSAKEENEMAMEAGCDDIITKPIQKELFQQKLLKYLNQSKK